MSEEKNSDTRQDQVDFKVVRTGSEALLSTAAIQPEVVPEDVQTTGVEQGTSPEQQSQEIADRYIESIPQADRKISSTIQLDRLVYAYLTAKESESQPNLFLLTSDRIGNLPGETYAMVSWGIGAEYQGSVVTRASIAAALRIYANDPVGRAGQIDKCAIFADGTLPESIQKAILSIALIEGDHAYSQALKEIADRIETTLPQRQAVAGFVQESRKDVLEGGVTSREADMVRSGALRRFMAAIYPSILPLADQIHTIQAAEEYKGFDGDLYSRDPVIQEQAAAKSRENTKKLVVQYQDLLGEQAVALNQEEVKFRQVQKAIEKTLKARFLESMAE